MNNKLLFVQQKIGKDKFSRVEIVEADLNNRESLLKAMEGVEYMLHVATPLVVTEYTYDQYMKVTEISVNAIKEGCKLNNVKKLIVTSTIATIIGVNPNKGDGYIYDEKDYIISMKDKPHEKSEFEAYMGYQDSKAYEEQLFLELIEEQKLNPEGSRTQVTILNPGLVLGPSLINVKFSSLGLISPMLLGEVEEIPDVKIPCVDIQDIIEAHYLAMMGSGSDLNGQRIILC